MIQLLALLTIASTPTPIPKAVDSTGKAEYAIVGSIDALEPVEGLQTLIPEPLLEEGYIIPSSGSGYTYGYCTWGISQWISIPPGLGNADKWAISARRMGIEVSTTPRIGSVGQTTAGYAGHVVLVMDIRPGQVYIKAMNDVDGWNLISYRWTAETNFVYIYF